MPASSGVVVGRSELLSTVVLEGKDCTNLILLIPQVVMYPASHGRTGAFSLLVSVSIARSSLPCFWLG